VDHFCSSSPWTLAAHEAFLSGTELDVRQGQHGFTALFRMVDRRRTVLGNTDQMWHFNCPLACSDPPALIAEVAPWLSSLDRHLVVVSGLPTPVTDPWRSLFTLGRLEPRAQATRLIVDLDADFDSWLRRRSRKFRANLRNADRRAADAGVVVSGHHDLGPDAMVDLLLEVERHSWKADHDSGLNSADMEHFYRRLLTHLAAGQARLWLAYLDGVPVGYVLGAVADIHYRGLQQSFDAKRPALGIGSVLAQHQLRELAQAGVRTVDLGMHIAYKARWADRIMTTGTLLVGLG